MKSFEIIEEGRLSKSEMSVILGGELLCTPKYEIQTCTINSTVGDFAHCSDVYYSCASNGSNKNTCKDIGGYGGRPYGGGDAVPDLPQTCTGATAVASYASFDTKNSCDAVAEICP